MEDNLLMRQKKEERRLKKIYKNLPPERLEMARKLIERAAYMLVSLEEMEAKISADGLMTLLPQGAYEFNRAHPLLSPYNTMIKNYNATIKQLGEFLPAEEADAAGKALMMFATKPSSTSATSSGVPASSASSSTSAPSARCS